MNTIEGCSDIYDWRFLADRTNGPAYATVLRPSVRRRRRRRLCL